MRSTPPVSGETFPPPPASNPRDVNGRPAGGPTREAPMRYLRLRSAILAVVGATLLLLHAPASRAACCYFAAKDKDVSQPAQKAFITWDPAEKVESFTVQPKFEGNAQDFGMVVPTPGRPKLDEMPRDFFKELAVFTLLKKREYPRSKLLVLRELDELAKEKVNKD